MTFQAIWNWIKYNAEEFALVQRSPSKKLSGKRCNNENPWLKNFPQRLYDPDGVFVMFVELCDSLFEVLVSFAESTKRKIAAWPLQIMLLMLSPVSEG